MDKNYNIAICSSWCDLDHLEEWYYHHKNMGFKNFLTFADKYFIDQDYANKEIFDKIENIKIIPHHMITRQSLFYTCICQKYNHYDYILFIDSDEYYMSKTGNIIKDINFFKEKHGDFDGLVLYWRAYGSNPPFENRVPINFYKQWIGCKQTKTLVNPNKVTIFPHPHFAYGNFNKYIDEKGRIFEAKNYKLTSHSSDYAWIKHVYTRSKSEWLNKINKKMFYPAGRNRRCRSRSRQNLNYFYKYNSNFIKIDG